MDALRLRTLVPLSALTLAALVIPRPAAAISCDEIVEMLNVNIPPNIVITTMADSGDQLTREEIKCLVDNGAPPEVLQQARRMLPQAPDAPVEDNTETPTRSMDDDQDRIGRSDRDDFRNQDLAADGPSSASSPEDIQKAIQMIESNRPLSASLALFELLEEGSFPDREDEINYYMGKSLEALEMYHTAQFHYMRVVRSGPKGQFFNYALSRMVVISRFTGDDYDLARVAKKLSPEDFPRGARERFYYLKGLDAYREDELSRAKDYFGQISTSSPMYLRSKYVEGVISNKQEKLKSAVRSFLDVYRADNAARSEREAEEELKLKDLSLVNVARVYYRIERFDEADKFYSQVSRESMYWPQAMYEQAWTGFMRNEFNRSLGLLLTVDSPFFRDDEYLPDATILRALTFFNLCQYEEVEGMLLQFEEQYTPIRDEMKDFVEGYASKEGRRIADQAWNTYFGTDERKVDTSLPKALFNRMLRNSDLSGLVRHMDIMDDEVEAIDDQKPTWRDSVGTYLKKIIQDDRAKYERRAGLLFLKEMSNETNYLSNLLTQSEIIRFEVIDAQRMDYAYKAENIELLDNTADDIDFAVNTNLIYWPFNGEFWEDELGYYNYTEQGACQ
ncbi:MAG: hypothetical protein AAFV53_17915 [Myxococcota bacterium]